jgi:hypothetical protein
VPVDFSELASMAESMDALARRVGKMGDAAKAKRRTSPPPSSTPSSAPLPARRDD